MKAPFPWFGGKSQAAEAVWAALGDVEHYVEPFAGSLAVLLGRPHPLYRGTYSETVNDIDGLLVNAWRSIQMYPEETAEWAAWPVTEADMHARHLALVNWRAEHNLELLMGTPEWCDPKMAGWWLWGVACWIGSGWCSGVGPWVRDETGRIAKRDSKEPPGVWRQRPHLSGDGRGVNHPTMREALPEGGSLATAPLLEWFRELADRLRWVRILNGGWQRAVTSGASKPISVLMGGGVCGVFLDPPYADTAGRDANIYAHDSLTVAHDVRAWALAHGADPEYRIVLACFEGEHDGPEMEAAGWRAVEWFKKGYLTGGMANIGAQESQQHRERLWLSPHCLVAAPVGAPAQQSLWKDE